MARESEPVNDTNLMAATQRLDALRERVREDLTADLGGDPEDDNTDTDHVDDPVVDAE